MGSLFVLKIVKWNKWLKILNSYSKVIFTWYFNFSLFPILLPKQNRTAKGKCFDYISDAATSRCIHNGFRAQNGFTLTLSTPETKSGIFKRFRYLLLKQPKPLNNRFKCFSTNSFQFNWIILNWSQREILFWYIQSKWRPKSPLSMHPHT